MADESHAMYRHHLEKLCKTRLDDVLLDEGVLDRARLEAVQAEQDQSGKLLSDVLVTSGGFDEWELAKLLVNQYGLPFLDVKLYGIRREVAELLSADYCKKHGVLPLDQFGPSIALACWEVPTPELLNEIIEKTGCTLFLYVGVRRMILEVLDEQTKKAAGRSMAAKAHASIAAPAGASVAGKPADAGRSLPAAAAALLSAAAPEDEGHAPLPPLDLPRISMKLNASAQNVTGQRKPQVERFTSKTGTASVTGAAPTTGPVGAHAKPATGPVHTKPATGPVHTKPQPAPVEPARPKIARTSPIIPAAKPAAAAAHAPAPAPSPAPAPGRAPAPAPGGGGGEWESIFDMGDSAVKHSKTGEQPRKGE